MTKDPIGIMGGDVNLYRYVANDPFGGADLYGLRNLPMDDGAVPVYKDSITGEFTPYSEVIRIEHEQALIAILAFPAIGAASGIAVALGPSVVTAGVAMASSPTTVANTIDFADTLSGYLGGPTTGLPPHSSGGAAATFLSEGYKKVCGP